MRHAKQIIVFCAGIALIAMAALSETQRARLGDLGRNSMVVTNVTDSGGAPGDYESISNRAMKISLPGDDDHPHGVYTPVFKGRANLSEGALQLTKSGQIAYPGRMKLTSREVPLSDGSVTQVMWPSFLDESSNERWVAAEPSDPEVTTALRWRADGTACVVTVAAGGTLTADTSEWTEGQAVMAIITLADGAGIEQGIELVGYGAWPVGTPFVACCYRIGLTVFVVPSTTL